MTNNQENPEIDTPEDIRFLAAQALTSLLKTGDPTNTDLSQMILDMLAMADSERVRLEALNGLHKLSAYNKEQGPPVVLSQINAELRRSVDEQSEAVQSGLANCSMFYGGGIMRSLLQPLAERSAFPKIKANAASMIQLSEMAEARKKKS